MWIDDRGSEVLPVSECRRLLALGAKVGLHGHLGIAKEGAPLVLPVDYTVDGSDVVLRIGDHVFAEAYHELVAFQVDNAGGHDRGRRRGSLERPGPGPADGPAGARDRHRPAAAAGGRAGSAPGPHAGRRGDRQTPPSATGPGRRAGVIVGDAVDLTAYDAWLFDLDGVVTDTARVHAAAWKAAFDPVLEAEGARTGTRQDPFDPVDDYLRFVDGRPRADGVRAFLASRGLELEEGSPGDPPGARTVCGIADGKNELVRQVLATDGVAVYPGTLALLELLRSREVRTAVVSASENTGAVLAAAGIGDLFDARVDGLVARALHLHGKPAPDTYLEAARVLGCTPVPGRGGRGCAGGRRGRQVGRVRAGGGRRPGRPGAGAGRARRGRGGRRPRRPAAVTSRPPHAVGPARMPSELARRFEGVLLWSDSDVAVPADGPVAGGAGRTPGWPSPMSPRAPWTTWPSAWAGCRSTPSPCSWRTAGDRAGPR